jgi:hypothetical protein
MSQESSYPPNQTACPREAVPRPSVAAIESKLHGTPMDDHNRADPLKRKMQMHREDLMNPDLLS